MPVHRRRLRAKPLLLRRFLRLVAEVWDFTGGGIAVVMVLATVAALAEGVGILLLIPLLGLLGGDAMVLNTIPLFPAITVPALRLEWILLIYVLLVSAAAILVVMRQLVAARLRMAFIRHLRGRLYAAVLDMEWSRFARQRAGALSHTLINDVDQADGAVEFLLAQAATFMQLLVAVTVALTLSPWTMLFCLVAILALAPLGLVLDRRIYRHGQAVGLAWQELHATLSDDLASFRLVKGFDMAGARGQAFNSCMDEVNRRDLRLRRILAIAAAVRRGVGAAAAAAAVLLLVRGAGLGLPETLAILVANARVLMMLSRAAQEWRQVIQALPAHARMRALLARCRNAAEPVLDKAVEAPRGTIVLDQVTVSHLPDRPPALMKVSAVIPRQGLVVLTGPSGAGKSTLGDLLLGLIEPDQGDVLVGGQALRGALRRAWRRRVAMVPQDPTLFHGTICANLMLAAPDASEAELWAALTDAGVESFVRGLPAGLATLVGERGVALSGGERQRLALARALLRQPDILILDEPTSALDAMAEAHVMATLRALRGRMTIILISHRAVPNDLADSLLRFEGGQLLQVHA